MDDDLCGLPTVYNGSANCGRCGALCTPYEAMFSQPALCNSCKNAKATQHVKNGMVS